MKNLKNNRWLAGITMIVLLLGVFFGVKAIEKNGLIKEAEKVNIAETTWHFTGSSTSEILDGSQWTTTDPNDPTCSTELDELPCQLSVDASVKNSTELEQYFDDEYSNNTNDIIEAASSRKPLP